MKKCRCSLKCLELWWNVPLTFWVCTFITVVYPKNRFQGTLRDWYHVVGISGQVWCWSLGDEKRDNLWHLLIQSGWISPSAFLIRIALPHNPGFPLVTLIIRAFCSYVWNRAASLNIRRQERQKICIFNKSNFALFARTLFIFVHVTAVLVLSTR